MTIFEASFISHKRRLGWTALQIQERLNSDHPSFRRGISLSAVVNQIELIDSIGTFDPHQHVVAFVERFIERNTIR